MVKAHLLVYSMLKQDGLLLSPEKDGLHELAEIAKVLLIICCCDFSDIGLDFRDIVVSWHDTFFELLELRRGNHLLVDFIGRGEYFEVALCAFGYAV